MEYEFELTEKANNDIEGILYYLSKELLTPKSATHFMDALMKGFDRICTFPESGEVLDNKFVPTDMIRRVLVGRYVIYYLIMKRQKRILILRVSHELRDVRNILQHTKFNIEESSSMLLVEKFIGVN